MLLVVDLNNKDDDDERLSSELPAKTPSIRVWNKTDIAGNITPPPATDQVKEVFISAKTGEGIDRLKDLICELAGLIPAHQGSFSARTRHLDALRRTQHHLQAGTHQLTQCAAPELLAEELRLAQKSLGEITGEFLPDDLLGAIFASFCIGK